MAEHREEQNNGHSISFRSPSKTDIYKRRRLWRKGALETIEMLNNIKLEESTSSEHNVEVYEVIREKLKKLREIDPEKKIHQDTLVETTVIKYDCPMCLPVGDSDHELELVNS